MSLHLYNTLTKKEEQFAPLLPPVVTMYTCGPTVYGRPHIGNFASFLMADLLRRWLEVGHGYQVRYAKNITDVGHLVKDADTGEDKIEKQAREEHGSVTHQSVIAIARKYEEQYIADEHALNILDPIINGQLARPRASEYVEQMKQMIESLLESKKAYITSDGIYFSVQEFKEYGKLSGNTVQDLAAGARVEVNQEKHHPADFALWKFCVGQNEHHALRWESPRNPSGPAFPQGFPGWHIECSAMSRSLLGDTLDLHTGGEDNIFPHHECEIAQSECVTGKPFVRHWLHKRRIDLAGEKMSKSLGNILTVPDIVAKGYSALDLRYYLLSVHYRTNLKFTWKGMDDAKIARRTITAWIHREGCPDTGASGTAEITAQAVGEFHLQFKAAMNSDLNTPGALAAVFSCMHAINKCAVATGATKAALQAFIADIRQTFGCFEPEEQGTTPAEVLALVEERKQARANKDFAGSDRLRDAIAALGYTVKDTKDGQQLERK